MIKDLYALAEKSETVEELVGNASELLELVNERSWLYAYWGYRAGELGGLKGLEDLATALPISPSTLRQYAETWKRFSTWRKKYPRLSFSFFHTCYQ